MLLAFYLFSGGLIAGIALQMVATVWFFKWVGKSAERASVFFERIVEGLWAHPGMPNLLILMDAMGRPRAITSAVAVDALVHAIAQRDEPLGDDPDGPDDDGDDDGEPIPLRPKPTQAAA
ncbi:MAG TPA: hypothetical protein VGK73_04000 [Polyangiaceae bacterium]